MMYSLRGHKKKAIVHIKKHHKKYIFVLATVCGYFIIKSIVVVFVYLSLSYYYGVLFVEYQKNMEYYTVDIFEQMDIQHHIQDEMFTLYD